jgi:hypothetical protein
VTTHVKVMFSPATTCVGVTVKSKMQTLRYLDQGEQASHVAGIGIAEGLIGGAGVTGSAVAVTLRIGLDVGVRAAPGDGRVDWQAPIKTVHKAMRTRT